METIFEDRGTFWSEEGGEIVRVSRAYVDQREASGLARVVPLPREATSFAPFAVPIILIVAWAAVVTVAVCSLCRMIH